MRQTNLDNYAEELNILHNKAMTYAEEAFFLERKGDHDAALKKYQSAFFIEKQVADCYIDSTKAIDEIEPSRSIICLSCAALARDAKNETQKIYYASKVIEYSFDTYFVEEANTLL